jgi:hypothetical protein
MNKPRFPEIFHIESIWFWCEKELEDIAETLAPRLGLTELQRDYENLWEWVDIIRPDGSSFNLCRMHNWKSGVYSDPVVISLRNEISLAEDTLKVVAKTVKETFGCPVFGGEIGHIGREIKIYDSVEL